MALADEAIGPVAQPGQASRRHLLEVNAEVVGGPAAVAWTYSPGRHQPATVERWRGAWWQPWRS